MVLRRRLISMRIVICFIIFLCFCEGFSQRGRLLLVGGGSEKTNPNGWSTPAYTWAGQGKKVAIIGTSTGALAPYFMQQCHAARAKEFAIATYDSANSQATYDTLVSYEVIFFRGGDQYEYYNLYRNTKLLDAVNYVYGHGGTICGTSAGMHILSSVVFTAKNGSAYPDECIEDPNNHYVTLANDFLDLFPGYLFDTHFAERARFGRLTGFLANYQLNHGQSLTGIGMDDMTCMTVDETGLGTVFGTGCANIYLSGSSYSLNGKKLLVDTLQMVQLLQGCTYNFLSGQAGYSTLDQQISTGSLGESANVTLLASGSDQLTDNLGMLTALVQGAGNQSEEILLLSGDQAIANTFGNKLSELGAPNSVIFKPDLQSGNDTVLRRKIMEARKILFIKNTYQDFSAFLGTSNGMLLSHKVIADSMITAFVGDNARFAGKTVVDNYLDLYASWYGELTFQPGLAILRHTVIMPNTFLNSDVYENTSTAVPYAMLRDTLKYGIWLTNHNYMKYSPVDAKAMLSGYGAAPVMVIANAGSLAGFSTQTATGSTSTAPRMVAGFEKLHLSLIDETTPYQMGVVQSSGIPPQELKPLLHISPNPVSDKLFITSNNLFANWLIIDIYGNILLRGTIMDEVNPVDVSALQPGLYIFRIDDDHQNLPGYSKFIKL